MQTCPLFIEIAGKIGKLIAEISAPSQEQSQGIQQVSEAMVEMDKGVQQNASGAEETASASVEMSAPAEKMKGYVAELTALVGGVGNENGVFPGKALKRRVLRNKSGSDLGRSPAIRGGIVPPAPARKTAGRGKERAVLDSQKARPDQVIPRGDEGFKEF